MNGEATSLVEADASATIRVLREELEATNREVLALTIEMDQRVEERTAELRAAREELEKTNSELLQLALELEDRVARRTEELRKAQDELELRVQERTADLTQTNTRLQAEIVERERVQRALRNAEVEAIHASSAKSQFLAHMSHEIRTPLNGVIGMTELLLGTNLDAQQRRYAWLAKSSGDALLSLINDVLDFSKIEAGKLELETIDFDLRYAVESVAAFASRAAGKGLELVASVHPEVPPLVRGDSGRLQQILMNLITNAIKFTERGEVALRATLEGQDDQRATVRFTVSDTGIGIPRDQLDRLFESFSQVDTSTTRKYGGTGLGLAICKRLVELMGGQVGVVSEEGKGSTFWFTVNLEKQSADRAQPQAILDDPRRLRVLVVDDNSTNREILREQLASWGLEHGAVESGAAALTALRAAATDGTPFGLAILDMQMPEMDGLQLGCAIKADPLIQNTILVLLTSVQTECDVERLRSAGFTSSLSKPVRQSHLLDTITEAIACAAVPVALVRDALQSRPAEPSRRASTTKGARILLAEDHEISQEVAATLLIQAGYECDIVRDGKQAVEAVLRQPYDLILMDCQMPEMDGFAATAAIRQAETDGRIARNRTARMPIIALTANAIKGDRERCLEAGMDDYVSKPLNSDKLVSVIESQLSRIKPGCVAERRFASVQKSPDESTGTASQTSARRPEPAPFDIDALLKQWGGDRALIQRLIPKFQRQAQVDVDQIEKSIAEGDAEATARHAHGLKGAAAYLCAGSLRECAARLEKLARAADLSEAAACLILLRQELERCLDYANEPSEAVT